MGTLSFAALASGCGASAVEIGCLPNDAAVGSIALDRDGRRLDIVLPMQQMPEGSATRIVLRTPVQSPTDPSVQLVLRFREPPRAEAGQSYRLGEHFNLEALDIRQFGPDLNFGLGIGGSRGELSLTFTATSGELRAALNGTICSTAPRRPDDLRVAATFNQFEARW